METKTGRGRGRRIGLSVPRRLVMLLLEHGRRVPLCAESLECDLSPLVAARSALQHPPSWTSVLMKAYSQVAQSHPWIRQAYIPFPIPHIYEHPNSEAATAIERKWRGEHAVFVGKIFAPERSPLRAIDARLRHYKRTPVWEITYFRELICLASLPRPLPWLVSSMYLYWNGGLRARRCGTFMVTTLARHAVEIEMAWMPLTSYLTTGPIRSNAPTTLRLIGDHRVADGRTAAKSLRELVRCLNEDMRLELESMADV